MGQDAASEDSRSKHEVVEIGNGMWDYIVSKRQEDYCKRG